MRPRLNALVILLAACLAASGLRAETFEMEAGDLRRSNASVSATAWTLPLEVQWMSQPCLYEPNANPLILPDRIIMHDRSRVVSLDRGDGHQQWSWGMTGHGYFWNSPAYDASRNRIYIGGTMGGLFALNAADGQPLWSVYEGTQKDCGSAAAVTFADDKILYKNGKKHLVCIDPDDQSEHWRFSFLTAGSGVTPALDNGEVYAATGRGEIVRLNWSTGALTWRVLAGSRTAYTGAVMLGDNHLYLVTIHGKVECRLRSNGSLVWSYQMDSYTYGNMALRNGILYCTSDDRCVHAVNSLTGAQVWKRCHTGNFARSSPFFAGDIIFSSGCTGEFYGDDATTGNNVWTVTHGADNSFNDWAYADGYLIGTNRVGTVYCFRSQCPACTPTLTYSPSATPSVTPSATPSATGTATPSATPSATQTVTPSASPTGTPSGTPSASPTRSATGTPSGTPSATPTATLTGTPSASPTGTPTGTPVYSHTASPSSTPTPTISPTSAVPPTATPAPNDAPVGLDDPKDRCYAYPNPSEGPDVHIVYRMDGPGQARIRVFQAAGDPAASGEERHNSGGVKRCTVPVSGFAPGVYFYKVDMRYDDGRRDKRPVGKFICRPK